MLLFIKYNHRPTDILIMIFQVIWDFTNILQHTLQFFLGTITNEISFRLQDNWIC